MRNSWVLLAALFGLIATIAIALLRHRRRKTNYSTKGFSIIANTSRTRELPEYKAAERRYTLLLIAAAFLFMTVFASISTVASRPVSVSVSKPEYENRDIMLCLDVSGSMNQYVQELLEYFSELIDGFKGQRVGMTIFDGVYLTIAPLSDDYDALSDLMEDLVDNTIDYQMALWNSSAGTSAIGPGLVGCIEGFDKLDEEKRSRAIILATDNFAQSNQIVTLRQAGSYAKRFDIAVYGLSTADSRSEAEINSSNGYEPESFKEFREVALDTGGAYYGFSDYGRGNVTVQKIVDQILEQAAARYDGAETLIRSDSPLIPTIIACICAVLFAVVIWRLNI